MFFFFKQAPSFLVIKRLKVFSFDGYLYNSTRIVLSFFPAKHYQKTQNAVYYLDHFNEPINNFQKIGRLLKLLNSRIKLKMTKSFEKTTMEKSYQIFIDLNRSGYQESASISSVNKNLTSQT
jgi:hypothetical protein